MDSTSVAFTTDVTLPRDSVSQAPAAAEHQRARGWPVAILGIPFDPVTSADALEQIDAMIASRRPHYVVTANVDFLVQARQDVELRRILIEADLVLCDGTPLLWAARWLGNALPERVAGSDLAPRLLERAAERGHRVFFLGAGPGVAAEAAARLQREFPSIQIVGHYSPPIAALLDMDHANVVERIRAAAPDILLVSFGCPKQEKWIAMHYRALGVPVCMGVGATIDFLAGRVKRAPAWMRRTGCEWLFRLWQEPRRLYRRYAQDALEFLPALAAQRWRMMRRGTPVSAAAIAPVPAVEFRVFDAGTEFTRETLQQDGAQWSSLATCSSHSIVDLSRAQRIDAAGVAFLVQCRRALRQRTRELVILGASPHVRAALETVRLAEFFTFANTLSEAREAIASVGGSAVVLDEANRRVAWNGEVTAVNVDEVWRLTSESVQRHAAAGAIAVSVDLAQLRFIDSAAVGMMLRLKKWAQALPVQVLFMRPQPNVRNVLRLARLDLLLLEGGQ